MQVDKFKSFMIILKQIKTRCYSSEALLADFFHLEVCCDVAVFGVFLCLWDWGSSEVQIIKQINNNAALARDGCGNEIVVLGRGIGFPSMPYELTDLSKIERSFYDVDIRYVDMIKGLPQAILFASADIVEQAEINLDCELNPNLPFTLADHLNFAIERKDNGIDITIPLAYDVQHLYPREYELGLMALDVIQDYTKIRLPDSEAVSVALHLINGENEVGDMHSVMLTLKIISDVKAIVEQELHIKLEEESYHYSRFTMHLRYLIQRLASGRQVNDTGFSMLRTMAREHPDIYLYAQKIAEYFRKTWDWQCDQEEILYLMLHISRIIEKNK